MYGDTAAMRRRAGQLREQATDLRALADRLVGQVEAGSWSGRAARDLRVRIQERAAHLRECATQHENAAESLARHLGEVDRLKDAIAGIERKAGSLVADAKGRIAQIARDDATGMVEPSDVDRVLDRFTPPPPGHKDWLAVTLPGL